MLEYVHYYGKIDEWNVSFYNGYNRYIWKMSPFFLSVIHVAVFLNDLTALVIHAMITKKHLPLSKPTFTRHCLATFHVSAYITYTEALTINVHNSREQLLSGENIRGLLLHQQYKGGSISLAILDISHRSVLRQRKNYIYMRHQEAHILLL